MKTLGIIIPCFNESKNLEENITKKLIPNLENIKNNYKIKVLLVDDGSLDNSWKVIKNLSKKYKIIEGVKIIKNFGKDKSVLATIIKFDFDIYMTVDSDDEHPFNYINKFLNEYVKGNNLVIGVRNRYGHSLLRKFYSLVYNLIYKVLMGSKIPLYTTDFRLFTKEIKLLSTKYFFKPLYYKSLFNSLYIPVKYIYFDSNKNKNKKSSFNFFILFDSALSNLTYYNLRPLKIIQFSIIFIIPLLFLFRSIELILFSLFILISLLLFYFKNLYEAHMFNLENIIEEITYEI